MNKVLIVDDDAIHRMVIARRAKQVGLQTTFAASAREAIETLSTQDFGVITLDLNLGEEQGTDVLEYLAEKDAAVKVFLISGSESAQHEAAIKFGLRARIDLVDFPKPINLPFLRECLEQVAVMRQQAPPKTASLEFVI
jgi:CheY-like chemotaxis protein